MVLQGNSVQQSKGECGHGQRAGLTLPAGPRFLQPSFKLLPRSASSSSCSGEKSPLSSVLTLPDSCFDATPKMWSAGSCLQQTRNRTVKVTFGRQDKADGACFYECCARVLVLHKAHPSRSMLTQHVLGGPVQYLACQKFGAKRHSVFFLSQSAWQHGGLLAVACVGTNFQA